MVCIEGITPLPDYRLRIEMGSGNAVELDMKLYFKAARFKELIQPELFNSVRTDGYSVIWGEKIYLRVGIPELLDMLQQPRDPETRRRYLQDVTKAIPSYLIRKAKNSKD